jgi:hypothetical protein
MFENNNGVLILLGILLIIGVIYYMRSGSYRRSTSYSTMRPAMGSPMSDTTDPNSVIPAGSDYTTEPMVVSQPGYVSPSAIPIDYPMDYVDPLYYP